MNTKPRDTAEHHAARRKRRWLGCLAILLTPVILIAILLGLFGLRLLDKPKITRDYLAEFNERYQGVPESDKAWPLYKQAMILKLENPLSNTSSQNLLSYPGWSDWDAAKERIASLKPALELIREGASKPVYGKALSLYEDPDIVDARGGPSSMFAAIPGSADDDPLWMAMLTMDDLGYIRKMAFDLAQDTSIALEQDQPGRAIEDIEAMLGLAAHASESETLLNLMARSGAERLASGTLKRVLLDNPQAFTKPGLARLQQAFMTIGLEGLREDGRLTRSIPVKLSMERAYFLDMTQRVYSDDGKGDGHMTLEGTKLVLVPLPGLVTVVLAESRKEAIGNFDEHFERFLRLVRMPIWERGDAVDQLDIEWNEYAASRYLQAKHPLETLNPFWPRMLFAVDRPNTERDAAITVIALHRYRLAHRSFPATLHELVPEFLPTLPLDPMDGKPLRYRLKVSGPVLYSIGADGDDDKGTPAKKEQDAYPGALPPDDGDWVLYPIAMPVEDDDE
jgi:hypothetical protein